jgi:hypothetical protein
VTDATDIPAGAVGSAASDAAARTPPLVAEVERLVSAGRDREAVLVAYITAEEHLRQVFRIRLPRQWTHREFLRRYLRADMGPSGELLTRLHARFEPVRYGPIGPAATDGLVDLLRALYREPPLRNTSLYASQTIARVTTVPLRAPPTGPPSRTPE